MSRSRKEEYERIRSLVNQWNDDHFDIFELSQPTEDLEFHGVVRFFFQGAAGANVITKCIIVSSTASTQEVIDILIEKFRPDMRMLDSKYCLLEVHANGEERRLRDDEKPLFVQLNWGNDVREGRFLLRNEDVPTVRDFALGFDKAVVPDKSDKAAEQPGFKRKLSKREKKEKKKREREKGKENANGDDSVASKLYTEVPETSFTRSISNPEAVMRRRRQQKLEKKLAQMNTADGGNDSGGTLKIFGEALCPDVPYKTLFLSTADPAAAVVKEAMEKYGLDKEGSYSYCLVEVLLPPGGKEYHGGQVGYERVLDDNECPLAIVMQHTTHKGEGHIIFQLRQREADYQKRSKRNKAVSQDDLRNHPSDQRHTNVDMLPYLLEMNVRGKPKYHVLPLYVTEVVNVKEVANNKSDYNGKHFLQLSGPDIRPRHCVIAHTEGVVTMTPNSQDAETYVERQRIYETTMLKHGMTVQFGKDRLYRFLDPRFEAQPIKAQKAQPIETSFDVDGKVESTAAQHGSQSSANQSWENQQRRPAPDQSPGSPHGPPGVEDLLPASVEYVPNGESRLLVASILEVNSKQLQFKLAPTYTLYMAVRNLLASRPPGPHKAQMIADFVSKTAKMTQQCIQEHHNDPPALAFWMANSSEILHMFKQDRDVQPLSMDSQEMLAEAVQMAFHHLVQCLQGDLQRVMPAFLNRSDDEREEMGQSYNTGHPSLADVLDTLSAAMTLLRRCRVNAALTIQLFSQLFHFINMWLFNFLVVEPQLQLCTRAWGLRLKRRLGNVEAWAEKQGLELAADCHLCRIIQAAHLLEAPKANGDDTTNISSTCFKLNSLQLRALLTRYIPEPNEPPVSAPFVERVVSIAENMADELTRTDGREVRLEEDPDLQLPFLLPEDGYTCDTIRGVPNGLPEFVRQLESAGVCRFNINNNASGSWTVYMGDGPPPELQGGGKPSGVPASPEVIAISFNKVRGSMGLSIVAATGEGQREQGIYIKSVVEGAAASLDGRLQAGDQLLEVDGKSLVGVTQDKAAELMTKTRQVVHLKVAKQGAFYHNLATLLSQPSPTSQRAAHNKGGGRTPPDEGAPPPYDSAPPPYDPKDPRSLNGYDKQAPSPGKVGQSPNDPYQRRDVDPRSKSTSNLHVDTSFERNSLQGQGQMKPAQSVGMLHPSSPGHAQYSPGGRNQDPRVNDYENQPQYPSGRPGDRESLEGSRHSQQNFNFADPRQNLPKSNNQGYVQQGAPHRTSDRSSISSRTSSNSNKDTRPQSAYYDPHVNNANNQDGGSSRPRSEDVTAGKMREWQDAYDDPRANYGRNNSGGNSPPYSNIGPQARDPPPPQHQPPPKPTAHERLFNQQGAPQRINVNSYNRQPNFYENTAPLQQEVPPPFHQLQRPPNENEMKSRVAQKPAVAPKKNQPRVPVPDSIMVKMDNRQTQPHFYGQERPPQVPSPHVVQPGYQQQPPHDSRTGQVPRQPGLEVRNGPDYRSMPDPRSNGNVRDQRDELDMRHQSDPRNASDLRNMPDPRNGPDLRNMHDSRNRPDLRNALDSRNGPDLRILPDPRNGPDPTSIPDTRNGQDYRHIPDPRNRQDMRNVSDPRSPQMPRDQNQSMQPDNRYQPAASQLPPGPELSYGYRDDLPPPPPMNNDMPPDLPPPPQMDDYQEDLPPLPPPPSQDAMVDQKLAEEQQKLMEQINATNQFLAQRKTHSPNLPSQPQHQPSHPQPFQQQQQPQQQHQPQRHPPTSHPQFIAGDQHSSQPARVLPPGLDARSNVPMGYQVVTDNYNRGHDSHPNYQNISFASDVRASSGPESQAPPLPQPPSEYESYDNPVLKSQGFAIRPGVAPKPKPKDTSRSAWDRDAREKADEEEQEELFKTREKEIADMEARPYLSPQDQDRLRKLKMEHEFQRRAREVAEKGDYDLEEDEDMAERIFTRERLIQNLKDDLEKSRNKLRDFEITQERNEAVREKERLLTMERRLEMYEKDREEHHQKMQKKQDRRAKEHQEQLRQQRENREKQRQNYEEQKRQLMKEEEKMNQRREEELNKRRQFERERRQELQEQRDAEEMRMRAEVRKEDNEYRQQQMAVERQQRLDQQRPIRVNEEKMRLDSRSQQPESPSYAQYANISSQGDNPSIPAPPPPERKSSYGYPRPTFVNNHQDFPPNSMANQNFGNLPSAMKNSQEPLPTGKKSVSFNTQMNTYKDRTPSHSISSYKSPTESQSSEQDFPPPSFSGMDAEVFDSNIPLPPPPPLNSDLVGSPTGRDVVYNTSNNTPNVIGAQEIYRDPRSRIEAKIASQSTNKATDRMSFREKMKYFAQEAGEDTIKVKPKTSKTLRDIESQLHGGQQYRGNVD